MNIIEHHIPRAQAPTGGMLLHCGAQTVSREDLCERADTTPAMKTQKPQKSSAPAPEAEEASTVKGETKIASKDAPSGQLDDTPDPAAPATTLRACA